MSEETYTVEETYNLELNKEHMLLIRKLLIDAELPYGESIEREILIDEIVHALDPAN